MLVSVEVVSRRSTFAVVLAAYPLTSRCFAAAACAGLWSLVSGLWCRYCLLANKAFVYFGVQYSTGCFCGYKQVHTPLTPCLSL